VTYYIFLDESGDHGLANIDSGFPVFALCGVVISESDYFSLIEDFRSIKEKFWGDQKVIFHSRDIRKCQKEFQILLDLEKKKAFFELLNNTIKRANYSVISSVIDKTSFLKKYGKFKNDVYEVALSFIIERAVFYLDSTGKKISNCKLIVEQRGKKEDKKLRSHFDYLFQVGTYYIDYKRIKAYNFSIDFKPKSQNISGLQLSDLIAYPIATYALDKTRANPAYDIIKSKIYSKGGKQYGLKIFP